MDSDRYYGHEINISLGNPPQRLRALIDTGSAFTLVRTKESDFCAARADTCLKPGSCEFSYDDGNKVEFC